MKKFLSLMLSIASLSSLVVANIASAATTQPYSPSEIVTEFDKFYAPSFDQINTDMKTAREMVRKDWEADADLYQFNIWYGQGESTYAFIFISEPNKDEAYHIIRGLDGTLSGGVIGRKAEWKYNFSGANLVLRNLLPIMEKDANLLTSLDKAVDPNQNTWVNFTLRTNLNGRVKWFIDFMSDAELGKANEFQVVAPAEKRWETTFQIKPLFRTPGEA